MIEYSELSNRVNKLMTVDLNDQIQQLMRNLQITPKQDKDLSDNIFFLLNKIEEDTFGKQFTRKYNVEKDNFKIILRILRLHRNYLAHPTPERLNKNNELLPKYYINSIEEGLLPFYKICSLETSVLYDYNAQLNYYDNNPNKMYSNGKIKNFLQIATVATGFFILGSQKDNVKKIIDKKK